MTFIGDNIILAIWSSAEYYVGIIAGSIPPCRALVLQTVHKFRDKASPSGGTPGVSSPRSSYFYTPQKFSSITQAWSRSRASSPGMSSGSRGSRSLRNNNIPLKPWNMKANRTISEDSGRESILPLHSESAANPDTGIWRTVDVRVGTSGTPGDDGSPATDTLAQR